MGGMSDWVAIGAWLIALARWVAQHALAGLEDDVASLRFHLDRRPIPLSTFGRFGSYA